jgi:pteridine reductase
VEIGSIDSSADSGRNALLGKAAVVTGASSAVGTAIARLLSDRGASVVVHANTQLERVQSLAEQLRTSAPSMPIAMDLRRPESPAELIDAAIAVFGRLDILVNCAASRTGGRLADITADMWDEAGYVTARAPFLCTQAAAPHLRRAGGTVINVSSTAASRPFAKGHHYVAAKAALEGMTRSLALELAPQVTVNAVAPGLVESAVDPGADDSWITSATGQIPLRRLAKPSDVALCVLFLATEGSYITGQTIVVDGGMTLGPSTAP